MQPMDEDSAEGGDLAEQMSSLNLKINFVLVMKCILV